ncbi:hypothetical protein Hdeb2414_s0019g00541311 [Helianthus debilis subsp. tardiflorus]
MAPSMENFYGNLLAIQTGIVKFNSILAPNRVSYCGAQQIPQIQSLVPGFTYGVRVGVLQSFYGINLEVAIGPARRVGVMGQNESRSFG